MIRQKTLMFFPLAAALAVSVACASSAPAATTAPSKPAAAGASAGNATQGKQLFAQNCSSCHGPEGKGLPGLGKDLENSTFVKGLTNAQLVDFIKKGRPATDPANTTKIDMPPKGGNPALTDAQLLDLATYIQSLK